MPVDNSLPVNFTEEEHQKLHQALDQFKSLLDPKLISLQTKERRAALKPRKNCESMIARCAKLARERNLSLEGHDLDWIRSGLQLRLQLPNLKLELDALSKQISDTTTAVNSELWSSFLAYYGVLTSIAQHDAALKTELKHIAEFMSLTRKGNKDDDDDGDAGDM